MKKLILASLVLMGASFFSFATGEEENNSTKVIIPVDDNFCDNLKKLVDASRTSFTAVKGEATTRMISGEERPFLKSTVVLKEGTPCYILNTEDAAYYPECDCYIVENSQGGTNPPGDISKGYSDLKKALQDCLGDGFKYTEKDKSNDLYLEDTQFKKLVALEQKDGAGKRLKLTLFMNNNRVLGHWVVELHIDGIAG